MSVQPNVQQINAFVDGELDLAGQLEVEARLRTDPALQAEVDRVRAMREAVRARGDYYRAPPAIRQRIAQLARQQTPDAAPAGAQRRERSGWMRWIAWRPLSASAGLIGVLALALNLWLLQGQREDRLEQEVIASHVRATLSRRQVDVESSDHHTVKPWLSERLDYSPPVLELSRPGSLLVGARVDYVDGRPVAALVYRHAGHKVDSFVWPAAQGDTRVEISSRRGFHVGHWTQAGMAHWVVSDLNSAEFSELVRELSKAD